MISEIEQETLDIDWFFVSGNKIGFVASGAGKLPETVANLDEKLALLSNFFRNLPETSGVEINEMLESIKGTNLSDAYLDSFIYFAKRGLYAFDKTFLNDFLDTDYHLVAKPNKPIFFNILPKNIAELIRGAIYVEDIEGVTIDVKKIK